MLCMTHGYRSVSRHELSVTYDSSKGRSHRHCDRPLASQRRERHL